RWMESGETIAQTNGIRIAEGRCGRIGVLGKVGGPNSGVIGASIFWNADARAARGICRIFDRDDRVEAVVRAAKENEEQLLSVTTEPTIGGESGFGDKRNVYKRSERGGHASFGAVTEEISPSEDVKRLHIIALENGERSSASRPCRER